MKPPPAQTPTIAVHVCRTCDPDPSRHETPAASGRTLLKFLRKALATESVTVLPTACLGGCECSGSPNGCCAVAFTGTGRFSYVLNQLNPATDIPTILELLRLYRKHPQGLIRSSTSPLAQTLKPHIATRTPPHP